MKNKLCKMSAALWLALLSVPAAACAAPAPLHSARPVAALPAETRLSDLRMLTDGGENAEAYWSPDGRELIFQSAMAPAVPCDQIYLLAVDTGKKTLVSTGKGRTTCAYFSQKGDRILYASTHAAGPECPPPPDRSQGYVWPIYPSYEIWSAKRDGSDLVRLTDNKAYDAEATVCPVDGSILFTSTRDGDLDLYRMDADGGNVRRLTDTPGYDGGAFFSADCKKIVWRASRPQPGAELDDFKKLLAEGLVRPGKLEIWVAEADGSQARQVTYLGAASFAPYFFPSGERILFSSNHGDPSGREFEIWAVDADGANLERITWSPGFDGFPMFSPDGKTLAFASNRHQGKPGETNVFVARWNGGTPAPPAATAPATKTEAPSDRFRNDVRWLADDAREGRGPGTEGAKQAVRFLADRMAALGLAPAYEAGFRQPFAVPLAVDVLPETAVSLDGRALARRDFEPAGFSRSTGVGGAGGAGGMTAPVVAAGYGIVAPEHGIDDFAGVDVSGKIALVRRFAPEIEAFKDPEAGRRYGSLRAKAFNARERGAVGLIVVDLPTGEKPEPDAPLPAAAIDNAAGEAVAGDAGIPVVLVSRAAGAPLFSAGDHKAALTVALKTRTVEVENVAGVVRAGAADRLPGAVVVGAHYDHLGHGGAASTAPGVHEVHNGADDNASGTAALLEIARALAAERGKLRRDVYLVAFAGEELGLYGSAAFVRALPAGLKAEDLVAMLNLDMVGRMTDNRLQVLGGESAAEWGSLVDPACAAAGVSCQLGGDGFGPSDHSSFYAVSVPVLHFFTGVHTDYHKPSDDAGKINAAGGAKVAEIVAGLAASLAGRTERLTLKRSAFPTAGGDSRSYGASLGTVPDFAGDGKPGVLLAGVRPGSPADKAGIRRGDRLIELAGSPIRDLYDMTFILRRAKPGESAKAVVEREGKKVEMEVVFAAGGRR